MVNHSATCITFACWNARGIMPGALYADHILTKNNIDILAISEHWLFPNSLKFLSSINVHYDYSGASDEDLCHPSTGSGIYCRGKGGVALLWHKRLSHCIRNVDTDDDRIIGIDINLKNNVHIVCFGVYLPSSNYSNELFYEYIDKLSDLHAQHSAHAHVIFLGDFNAQISGPKRTVNLNRRGVYLSNFIDQTNMRSLNMSAECHGPLYSFCPYKTIDNRTMIDHIIVPVGLSSLFFHCAILDEHELNTSDHLPIIASLNAEPICFKRPAYVRCKFNWKKLTPIQIAQTYELKVKSLLEESPKLKQCKCPADIDTFYQHLIQSLQHAGELTLPMCRFKKHIKPKWSSEVAPYHAAMRAARIIWIKAGRPRSSENPLLSDYKNAKRVFRRILRNLYISLEREFLNEIDKSAETDQHLFWNLLNRNKSRKSKYSEMTVNNKTYRTPREITQMWADYFSDLYSPKDHERFDNEHKTLVESKLSTMITSSHTNHRPILDDDINIDEVSHAVKSLKRNKSFGSDSISNEHLIHGGNYLCLCLTHLFNLFMSYEHIPADAKHGIIKTIPKPGKKCYSQRQSYRGITLLPSIYKLFETVILNRFKKAATVYNLNLCHPLQNAYQSGLCCLMTSFILQETVNYYLERGSKTYCCMVDASSAFDTVWQDGLFFKLYNVGINGRLWRVLRAAYECVNSQVLFDGCLSPHFKVKQSVRQGGVLSAWLYIIFYERSPCHIRKKKIRCFYWQNILRMPNASRRCCPPSSHEI